MKLVFFYSSILVFASSLVAEEKKIEDCTKILDNNDRLSCFDSFFLTDKKQILVNQEDIEIFEEKIDDEKKGKEKQIFSRGNFKKKTIHKIIPRKKKNVRFVLRIKREKERERDEEDGGCICCPCD